MPDSKYSCIVRRDLATPRYIQPSPVARIRKKLWNHWLTAEGEKFWNQHELIASDDFHRSVIQSVATATPLAVGRLGSVEASILMWDEGAANLRWPILSLFSDTSLGAMNAGIRPRNKDSYRMFARLCREALDRLDLQGVWMTGYEAICLGDKAQHKFFNVEITGPDGSNPDHWLTALRQKRVLVVSPFKNTIEKQTPRLADIWPGASWMEGVEFTSLMFPYLIDESCLETWWEVYDRIGSIIFQGDYDVALFGCGGLGLLFAKLAKDAGRVGIHIGGHLQLLFGIYGKRHLQQPWHLNHINDTWVRPESGEVAQSAGRVEGGCYW